MAVAGTSHHYVMKIFATFNSIYKNKGGRTKILDNFWQENNFRMEPWGSDYEPPIELTEEIAASESEVKIDVEGVDWVPLKPKQQVDLPSQIIFLDGRRRIDVPLVGKQNNAVCYGFFGTVGVGAVIVNLITKKAAYSELKIHRILGFSNNQVAPPTAITRYQSSISELVYQPIKPSPENTPQIRKVLIQNEMLKAEDELAASLVTKPDTLLIRDGQLRWYGKPDRSLGYIKTLHKIFLDATHAEILWKLAPGERTPIFAIDDKSPLRRRWSWYLRSGSFNVSTLGLHGLHGIVRLELYSEAVELEQARVIANQSTYIIPYYASHPIRDPRAPQNLTPVGALERELGRRMGNQRLIRRRIQNFLALEGNV